MEEEREMKITKEGENLYILSGCPYCDDSNHCVNYAAIITRMDSTYGFGRRFLEPLRKGSYIIQAYDIDGMIIEVLSRQYSCSHKTIKYEERYYLLVEGDKLRKISVPQVKFRLLKGKQ